MKNNRKWVLFSLFIMIVALVIVPGTATARSPESSSTGRYLFATYLDPRTNVLFSVNVGDYRYFDTRFNIGVQTRYVQLQAGLLPTPQNPNPLQWIKTKYYLPDEDFGLNFNFGEKVVFVGEIDGNALSVAIDVDSKMYAYQYNTDLYRFDQQQKYGAAHVEYSRWFNVPLTLPADVWAGSLLKSVAIPLD